MLVRGDRIEASRGSACRPALKSCRPCGQAPAARGDRQPGHCREPGLTHKATIASEVARRGLRRSHELPRGSNDAADDRSRVLAAKKRDRGRHMSYQLQVLSGATNTNLDDTARRSRRCVRNQSVRGRLDRQHARRRPPTLESIFREASRRNALRGPRDDPRSQRLARGFGDAVPMSEHPKIRSGRGVSVVVARGRARSPPWDALHVLHLTTARESRFSRQAPSRANESRRKLACITSGMTISARRSRRAIATPAIKTGRSRRVAGAHVVADVIDGDRDGPRASHARRGEARGYPRRRPDCLSATPLLILQSSTAKLSTRSRRSWRRPLTILPCCLGSRSAVRPRRVFRRSHGGSDGSTLVDAAEIRQARAWSPLRARQTFHRAYC